MRNIGLHLRITSTLLEVAQYAQALNMPIFQCFLLHQKTKKHLQLHTHEVKQFLSMRSSFQDLYVHGAYWINLCSKRSEGAQYIFHKELAMAQRLAFSYYVLHPGCATGWTNKKDGIAALAKILNSALKKYNIIILLENTGHGGKTVGNDVHDFVELFELLAFPEKVRLCIDTAHAYVFGYEVGMQEGQNDFFALLKKLQLTKFVKLIHLNDTNEKLGSKNDRHVKFGAGKIGVNALKEFVRNPALEQLPIIAELPHMTREHQEEILQQIREWL